MTETGYAGINGASMDHPGKFREILQAFLATLD